MKLTKREIQSVNFTIKGKWYLREDVDRFMNQLTEAAEKALEEKEELNLHLLAKEEEVKRLREEATEKAKASKDSSVAYQLMLCGELVKERNGLIEEIKMLRKKKARHRLKPEAKPAK